MDCGSSTSWTEVIKVIKHRVRSDLKISRFYLVVLLVALFTVSALSSCAINPSAPTTQTSSATGGATTTTTLPAATTTAASTTAETTKTTETSMTAQPSPTPTERKLLPPVETNPPNTAYAPAFAGQTRAPGIVTETPYTVAILTADLKSPWAVTALPDGRLLITEKAGALRIVTTEGQVSRTIGGFPQVDDRSQGGLLDVAPAPDFTTSRMIYVTLAERTSQGSVTAVGRGRLSDDESRIENFEIVWRALPYYNNKIGRAHV